MIAFAGANASARGRAGRLIGLRSAQLGVTGLGLGSGSARMVGLVVGGYRQCAIRHPEVLLAVSFSARHPRAWAECV